MKIADLPRWWRYNPRSDCAVVDVLTRDGKLGVTKAVSMVSLRDAYIWPWVLDYEEALAYRELGVDTRLPFFEGPGAWKW